MAGSGERHVWIDASPKARICRSCSQPWALAAYGETCPGLPAFLRGLPISPPSYPSFRPTAANPTEAKDDA